jgi:hypothetical protein
MPDLVVDEQTVIAEWFPEQLRDQGVLTGQIQKRRDLDFAPVVQQALALVTGLLGARQPLPDEYGRFVWRLDESNKLKTVPSIITKVCREIHASRDDPTAQWRTHTDSADAFLDHFLFDILRDIARFRVVCNYTG